MLKNKKAIYLLIPLNIAIWGFFIYRIYKGFADSEELVVNETKIKGDGGGIRDTTTYKLNLNYKDPFLKDVPKTQNHSNLGGNTPKELPVKKTELKVKVTTATVTPKPIPEIKYLGLIKNSTSGVSTALVSLNGQSKLIKANEVLDGVTFKSFDNTELIAVFGKEKITIKK